MIDHVSDAIRLYKERGLERSLWRYSCEVSGKQAYYIALTSLEDNGERMDITLILIKVGRYKSLSQVGEEISKWFDSDMIDIEKWTNPELN